MEETKLACQKILTHGLDSKKSVEPLDKGAGFLAASFSLPLIWLETTLRQMQDVVEPFFTQRFKLLPANKETNQRLVDRPFP